MPFTKTILLSYQYKMLVPFGFGEYQTVYELTLLKTTFWGLIKSIKKVYYNVSMFRSISEFERYLNKLIRQRKNLK